MAIDVIQLPPDSSGKKIAARSYTESAQTVYAQAGYITTDTAGGNPVVVTNAAPGASDYALVTRPVGFPAAAALADAQSNPTLSSIQTFMAWYNGSTFDRARSIEAVSAAPTVKTGVQAVGIGPGFDVKLNPANLGTAANAAVTQTIDGAAAALVHIGTSTTGTLTIEVTGDDTNWTAAAAMDTGTDLWASGLNLTPTANKAYLVRTGGWRQLRVRTVTTLGATVAVKFTMHQGSQMLRAIDTGAPPHNYGYSELSTGAQYTTAQTSTTIGPTVTATQFMVVTSLQIQAGGTVAGTQVTVYFGTGAYTRGTSRTLFDGEFAPSATSKPGAIIVKPTGFRGALDEELKITNVGAINPLTVTAWYYLVGV